MTSGQRIAPLDGIRGIAIAAVLVYHFLPGVFPGGGWGVLLFFVLSGYLITSILLSEHQRTGQIDLRAFYVRRALRLLPALYVLLIVFVVIGLTAGDYVGFSLKGTLIGAGAAFLYLFNWLSFTTFDVPHSMTPLYTLSVEEQFYILWPFALLLLLKLANSKRAVLITLLGAIGFGVISGLAFERFGITSYYRTWTWILPLLAGAALAMGYDLSRSSRWQPFVARLAAPASVLLIVSFAIPTFNDSGWAYWVTIPVLTVCAVAVLIWVREHPDSRTSRVLGSKFLVYLGRRSYGLYLWNLLVFYLLSLAVAQAWLLAALSLIVTVFIAELSYRFIEMPALKAKRRFERGAVPSQPHGAVEESARGERPRQ